MGRKIVCLLMTLVLVLGLVACGDMSGSEPDSMPVFSDVENEEVPTTTTTEDENESAVTPTTTTTEAEEEETTKRTTTTTEAEEEETTKRTTTTTKKKTTAKTTKKTTKKSTTTTKKSTKKSTTTKKSDITTTKAPTTTTTTTTKKPTTTTTKKSTTTTEKPNTTFKKPTTTTKKPTTTTKKPTAAPTTAPQAKVYGAGETWRVDGEWEFTINSVEVTEACNQYADEVGEQVVLVHYTYKNLGYQTSSSDSLRFHSWDFNVYDEEGEAAETYPCTHEKDPKECIVGTKCTASAAYMLSNSSTEITIAMEKYINTEKEKATFKVPVTKGGNNADDAEPTGYAQVKGRITYDDGVSDKNAKVMLIPKNNNVKNYNNSLASMFYPDTYESGIMIVKCDSYGRFDFGDKVPAGEYLAVALSQNAMSRQKHDDPSGWEQDVRDLFGEYFTETELKTLMLTVNYWKIAKTEVTLKKGDVSTIDHDFGQDML